MAKKRTRKQSRPARRRAHKKKTARRKTTRARKRRVSSRTRRKAVTPSAPTAEVTIVEEITFEATEAGCLDQEVATSLVFSCIPSGPVQPSTPLATLFPSDVQRRGFCGCVFRKAQNAGSPIGASDVPCSATNTVGEVIDAISC